MAKSKDRRVERTRNLIRSAFVELMQEKGYSALTVQDIIDRANVGRSTFYAHFVDKEQLLMEEFKEFEEFLRQQRGESATGGEESGMRILGFGLAMFEHAEANYQHFQALFTRQDVVVLHQQMQKMLVKLVQEELTAVMREVSSPLPINALAQFAVNAYWSLLVWWLEHGMPYKAQEMERLTYTLITSGMNSIATAKT